MARALETILTALHSGLGGAVTGTVLRNDPLPASVPDGGLMILRDGDPGEPEVTLSPLTYHYVHVADLEVFAKGAARDAAFDAMLGQVETYLAADRTLGGLCDYAQAEAPVTDDLPFAGIANVKAGIVPIHLHFATASPLS